MSSTGPSIRAVCRVINRNSCGSGSICGHHNGGSLVLTNAHVAGTNIGRVVDVEVESQGMRRMQATVIRAAYSNQVSADWALLFIEGFQDVQPVWLSKNLPAADESLYTKGFPRCVAHSGTDIAQHRTYSNGVLLWLPNAIGGQSGSGVWSDNDHLQRALLTWSMNDGRRQYGAGQLTAEIYRQSRAFEISLRVRGYGVLVGNPKWPGLTELPGEWDMTGIAPGHDDPVVVEGIFPEREVSGIREFPIWAEDMRPDPPTDPPDPTDPGVPPCSEALKRQAIESLRQVEESAQEEIMRWEQGLSKPIEPDPNVIHDTFGL